MIKKVVSLVALAAVALSAAGCLGSKPVTVKGEVTLDGEPVEGGSISFLTAPGTAGSNVAAAIEGGRFEVPADRGTVPGSYRVEVSWPKKTGRKVTSTDPGFAADETREAIPARYRDGNTLTAELKPGDNVLNLPLTTRP